MPVAEDFDLKAFQDKVLKKITLLNCLVNLKEGFDPGDVKPASQGFGSALSFLVFKSIIEVTELLSGPPEELMRVMKEEHKIDESTEQAREFLKKQESRQLLCPTLRDTENTLSQLASRTFESDVREIACAITPVLAHHSRTGDIELPLDPMRFALSAWLIARTGVAKYCAGHDRTAEEAHDH